jgi:hypothetical protein
MSTIDTAHELQDRLQSYISESLEKKLEELFKDQAIEVRTYLFVNQETNEADLSISIDIGTKFYEISEAVASGFEEYCAREELTDEECYEAYERAYKEELREINEEYAIPVQGKFAIKLSKDSGAEIELYPLECDGDYCLVGLGVNVNVSQAHVALLEQNKDVIVDSIVRFIESIYDLYATL